MSDATLTRELVLAAMERPVEQTEDGQWRCRMCPQTFATRKAIPVHELTHRREFGLAPPPHRGHAKGPSYLTCRYDGCTDQLFRTSLPMHLRSKKHGLSRTEASFYARKRSDEERGLAEPSVPVVIETAPEPEAEESFLTDLAPEEAVTGILNAAVTDGLMPVRMLPSVLALVGHTHDVLEELRNRRGDTRR